MILSSRCENWRSKAPARILPHFMGRHERLVLLDALPGETSAAVWLLTHVNLRHTRRISVFMQHVAEAVRAVLSEDAMPPEARAAGGKRATGARRNNN